MSRIFPLTPAYAKAHACAKASVGRPAHSRAGERGLEETIDDCPSNTLGVNGLPLQGKRNVNIAA